MKILELHFKAVKDLLVILESELPKDVKDKGVKEVLLRKGLRMPVLNLMVSTYLLPHPQHLPDINRPYYLGNRQWLDFKVAYFEKLLSNTSVVGEQYDTEGKSPTLDIGWANELAYSYLYIYELLQDNPCQGVLDDILAGVNPTAVDINDFISSINVEIRNLDYEAVTQGGKQYIKFPNNTLDLSKLNLDGIDYLHFGSFMATDVNVGMEINGKPRRAIVEVIYPDLSTLSEVTRVHVWAGDTPENYGMTSSGYGVVVPRQEDGYGNSMSSEEYLMLDTQYITEIV